MVILILLSGAFLIRRSTLHHDGGDDFIARIDGVPIHTGEFGRAASAYRDRVASGDISTETAMQKALEESVKIKIRQLIAQEEGLYPDISYAGFLRQLQQENKKREQAIKNGEVVFGPSRYSEEAYFEYVLGQITLSAKRRLLEREWKPDEQALKQFYEANKSRMYLVQGSVKVKQLSISFLNANQEVDETLKKQAKSKMDAALAMAVAGTEFENIAKASGPEVTLEERVIGLSNERTNLRSPVAQAAAKLADHEFSGVIEENGRFYLIESIGKQKEGSGYLEFKTIHDQVLKDYADFKYEDYVQERISKAPLVLNEAKYRSYRR